jgi:hypothetical protein
MGAAPHKGVDAVGPVCEGGGEPEVERGDPMAHEASGANDDLKAKMREALEKKNARGKGVPQDGQVHEKAHGSEVVGKNAGTQMHRRKAGGGGA